MCFTNFTTGASHSLLAIGQEGVPDVIPLEGCHVGRQQSLVLLAKRVEAEIPDGA